MANNRTRENGIAGQEKTLWLPGSHSAQTKYQHQQACLEMEPTAEAEQREANEQLATVNGGGDERSRLQLATVKETVTIQRGMERLPQDLRPPRGERVLVKSILYICGFNKDSEEQIWKQR